MWLRNVTAFSGTCVSLPGGQMMPFNWNVSYGFFTSSHLPIRTDYPYSEDEWLNCSVIIMQGSDVLIEERKKNVAEIFSKPLMNKFSLSKQHGLVLMLHRAMEEEKRKCRKGGEGHDCFKYWIYQRKYMQSWNQTTFELPITGEQKITATSFLFRGALSSHARSSDLLQRGKRLTHKMTSWEECTQMHFSRSKNRGGAGREIKWNWLQKRSVGLLSCTSVRLLFCWSKRG